MEKGVEESLVSVTGISPSSSRVDPRCLRVCAALKLLVATVVRAPDDVLAVSVTAAVRP